MMDVWVVSRFLLFGTGCHKRSPSCPLPEFLWDHIEEWNCRATNYAKVPLYKIMPIYVLERLQRRKGFGEGNGNPFQYSHLENPLNRSAW